jgi:hypothetical protein
MVQAVIFYFLINQVEELKVQVWPLKPCGMRYRKRGARVQKSDRANQ